MLQTINKTAQTFNWLKKKWNKFIYNSIYSYFHQSPYFVEKVLIL